MNQGTEEATKARLRMTYRVRTSSVQRAKSVAKKVGLNGVLGVGKECTSERGRRSS